MRSRVSRGWDFKMERHFVAFEELIRMIDIGVLGGENVFRGGRFLHTYSCETAVFDEILALLLC